ncbi:tyrosine-type recombinase/integrase [Enterococcus cecorum]|uniref:tyrosine-type recombinase/integrase n=1 Tax=Enterococcus cecorum TaxID=44008 RepID=UPI00148D908F|nr:site-specific integrase [Enterococcus cecorum]MCJ0566995.1 site-specific integrase [Enterococcus cecorum]
MSKYEKTKYPNIYMYTTRSGTKYRIRKKVRKDGKESIIDESGFKTLNHVKARLREIEHDIDIHEIDYFKSKKLTVSEYYEEYSNRKSITHVWSIDSKRSNDSLFKNHIKPIYGNTPLIQLSRENYIVFISEKLKVLSRSSVESIHVMFMAMLNDAVYNGIIQRNRLQRVPIGESNIPPKNKRISLSEYQLWMKTAKTVLNKYEYSMVYLCVFGLRRGEVCGIKPSAVRFDEQNSLATVHIVDSRTQNTSKTGKGGLKTKSSERFVVLDHEGTEALKFIIDEAREIKRDYGKILHQDEFLLLNPATCEPFVPSQLNRLFNRVSDSCDIKISPHMLRHFFATQAVIAGVPLEHTAAYLGHNEKTMTEHYTHIRNETAENVISLVSKRIKNNAL